MARSHKTRPDSQSATPGHLRTFKINPFSRETNARFVHTAIMNPSEYDQLVKILAATTVDHPLYHLPGTALDVTSSTNSLYSNLELISVRIDGPLRGRSENVGSGKGCSPHYPFQPLEPPRRSLS
jgi:hypothetical protein